MLDLAIGSSHWQLILLYKMGLLIDYLLTPCTPGWPIGHTGNICLEFFFEIKTSCFNYKKQSSSSSGCFGQTGRNVPYIWLTVISSVFVRPILSWSPNLTWRWGSKHAIVGTLGYTANFEPVWIIWIKIGSLFTYFCSQQQGHIQEMGLIKTTNMVP